MMRTNKAFALNRITGGHCIAVENTIACDGQGLRGLADRPFLFVLTCHFAEFLTKTRYPIIKLRKGVWETEN